MGQDELESPLPTSGLSLLSTKELQGETELGWDPQKERSPTLSPHEGRVLGPHSCGPE